LKKKEANELPADLTDTYKKITSYRDNLKLLGLRDYQVAPSALSSPLSLPPPWRGKRRRKPLAP
jgi:hypothetical protein